MDGGQDAPSQPKKTALGRKVIKYLLFFLLIIILLAGISVVAANNYLASNKAKIFENIEFLNNGSISFGKTSISIYKNFPSATISIENLIIKDSSFKLHQLPTLKLSKLTATTSIENLLKNSIEIKSIGLYDGVFNIHRNENGYNNLKSLLNQKSTKITADKAAINKKKKLKIRTNNLSVNLSNIAIHITDRIKNTSIHGRVEHLNSILNTNEKDFTAQIDMLLAVEELALRKQNGSFIANSKVSGQLTIGLKDSIIHFQPFELQVNEERFLFSGEINTKGTSISTLTLENQKTKFDKTLPLLPWNIRRVLKPYQIAAPFYSKTQIKSNFKSGDHPTIEVAFRMKNTDLVVHDIDFKKASFSGRFINRIYDDKRALEEGKKRIRVEIKNLTTRHEGFNIESKKLLITSTPENGPKIRLDTKINGEAAGISKWLENDQFFFDKGSFDLIAKVQGPLNDFKELVIESNAELKLNDFSVVYTPANVTFPFKEMTLSKKTKDAYFTIINSSMVEGYDVHVDGGLHNLAALILELIGQQASSEVAISSNKIGWTDFINLFGANGYLEKEQPKTDEQKKTSMKETIRGIQYNFQPRLSFSIDTLQYLDILKLHNFKTGIHFENANTIILEKTSFNHGQGNINFSGRLDIRDPHQTPFEFELQTNNLNLKKLLPPLNYFNVKLLASLENLPEDLSVTVKHKGIIDDQRGLIPNSSTGEISFKSQISKLIIGKITYESIDLGEGKDSQDQRTTNTKIQLEGDPALFNDFFKTEDFFFNEGTFSVQFDYQGNIESFEQLLNEAKATFSIRNSQVFYKPTGITFPLTQIDLFLYADEANFNFFLKSDYLNQELQFDGVLKNLSELLIGNTKKSFKSTINISSPKLSWQNFLDLFAIEINNKKEKKIGGMKTTVKGMLNTFNPIVRLKVDTFIYSDKLFFQDVSTGIHMLDTNTLAVDKTGFNFRDGYMGMHGQFDLSTIINTPFKANIHTEDLDVARLLESLDYLSFPMLQDMEKLSGRISMNLDLSGMFTADGKHLIPEATEGTFDFNLKNVILKGFAPIDTIAAKIKRQDRFKELRFGTISNKISIKGQELEIPLMEIQSNALNVFVEGKLSFGDKTDVWVSIPLDNLRTKNLSIIPQKRGYAATRRKFYIEVTSDEEGKTQFKLYPTKKKMYKDQGILKQYRKDKRRYRRIRKALRAVSNRQSVSNQ